MPQSTVWKMTLLLRRLLTATAVAALVVGSAIAGPRENTTETYRGEVVGVVIPEGSAEAPILLGEADVISSHLGRGTQASVGEFMSPDVLWGHAETRSANGDVLELEFWLTVEDGLDGRRFYQGYYVLTGGSGRFERASGSGEIFEGLISQEGFYSHRFAGQIFYPNPNRKNGR